MDALDDVVDPLKLLRFSAEFCPVARGGLSIHFLDQLFGGDSHLVSNGCGEAFPPLLGFLVEFLLFGEIQIGEHDG